MRLPNRAFVIAMISSLPMVLATTIVDAEIVEVPRYKDTIIDSKTGRWEWGMSAGLAEPHNSFDNWLIELRATAAVPKTLTLKQKHDTPDDKPHPGDGHPGAFQVTHTYKDVSRPVAGTLGFQTVSAAEHNGNHHDLFRTELFVGVAGPAVIKWKAAHFFKDPSPAKWSYKIFQNGFIDVEASYPNDPNRTVRKKLPVKVENIIAKGKLPKSDRPLPKDRESPTDYVVRYADRKDDLDPFTDTTLSFVQLESDGSYSKANLSEAAQLILGADIVEYVAPMVFTTDTNLYVGIDLAEWLLLPTPFEAFDAFTLTGGVSDQLPGFLVGTSPVTFDAASGYVTDNPYTGTVQVVGEIDGGTIPEPSAFALAALALVSLLACGGRRRAFQPTHDPRTGAHAARLVHTC